MTRGDSLWGMQNSKLSPVYEPEPAHLRVLGSVAVRPDLFWSGSISLPEDGSRLAIVRLKRHGIPGVGDDALSLTLPEEELAAFATLLSGLALEVRERRTS
jgi:hypothetical protein